MMIGGYYSFQGINGGARYHKTPVEEVLPVTCLPVDDRVEVPEGFAPVVDRPAEPSDPEGSRDGLADPARLQRGDGQGRRRGSGDRCRRSMARCRCSSPAATARAARSPGPRISARTGCRRSSSPGTATRRGCCERDAGAGRRRGETLSALRCGPCRRQCLHRHDVVGLTASRPPARPLNADGRRRGSRRQGRQPGGRGRARRGARCASGRRSATTARRTGSGAAWRRGIVRRTRLTDIRPGRRDRSTILVDARRREHDRQPASPAPQPSIRCADGALGRRDRARRHRRHAGQSARRT